ncbi:LacI family DNA-binding transcriptional regulator [Bifidobacterium sp. ESL0763]|uniref:LacI family DNA-binding transcriptional regulator n=1 Tax=Bifidobacterium sp. ESL0763 TaxID=2983227 RepID=UPI0023F62204|nr:LacI family DNA-binding transcriptional regulator [Bifidobacterium sp. ESL0763]MDF7663359.1 LacI family DNA-binding transcriptional regulator [Bifidobacterium sp. ESL0763]
MQRPHTKVTIRDVASRAKVSTSTVSRAFSRPDRVSATTAKRVFKAADELGYHSEAVDVRPIRHRKGLIAILVPDISNQFYSDIMRSVQRQCFKHGLGLIVSETRESPALERIAFDKVVKDADGVILVSSRMTDAMIRKCAQARPLVVVNRAVRGVPSVVIDVRPGIRQAIEQLQVSQPGADITYLDGPASSWSVGVRWKALRHECQVRGIHVRRFWPGTPTFEGGYACVDRYLDFPTSAVIAHNDMMAIGFVAGMRKRGLQCPRDFSVIGFDDDLVGRMSNPSISSIHMSLPEVGAYAEKTLRDVIGGDAKKELFASIPTSFVLRESTRGGEPPASGFHMAGGLSGPLQGLPASKPPAGRVGAGLRTSRV